ncbi:hypothetical protein ERJ70_02935 [Sediminibacillus dalangtanensis]|uniref:Uncharacterized protein n=1 Tax=Sediminibacillus dalangtanensis TaxID=2729421 RepID=A0ABX7VND2_9BACI|nr:hypothetical protein [Sediminibacillus dalangtanensis]QTM98361.1 hypothetical protein ERJ70_02935 [Sediminibacillus dalangtanensis]
MKKTIEKQKYFTWLLLFVPVGVVISALDSLRSPHPLLSLYNMDIAILLALFIYALSGYYYQLKKNNTKR